MTGASIAEWELRVSQRDAAQDLARCRKAERDALAGRVAALREGLAKIVTDAPRMGWARDPALVAREALANDDQAAGRMT